MKYTLKTSIKGRPMYYKENKLISKNDIPQVVLNNMVEGAPYDYVIEGPQEVPKECLFCGAPAKLTRMVNAKILALCHDHFYDKNIGQIAQKLRELNEAS